VLPRRGEHIFTGERLPTTANVGEDADTALFARLGLTPLEAEEPMRAAG
jgi:biotin synthase